MTAITCSEYSVIIVVVGNYNSPRSLLLDFSFFLFHKVTIDIFLFFFFLNTLEIDLSKYTRTSNKLSGDNTIGAYIILNVIL